MNTSETSDDVDLIDLGTDTSSTLDNDKKRAKQQPEPWTLSLDKLMSELSTNTSTKNKYIVYSVGNPTLILNSLDPQQLTVAESQLLDKHLTDVKVLPPSMPMFPDPQILVQGMKRYNVKQRASRATFSRDKLTKGVVKGRYRTACGEVKIYPKHNDVRQAAVPKVDPDAIPSTSRGLASTPRPSTVPHRKSYSKRQAAKASTNKGQASKDTAPGKDLQPKQ
ncbi:Hypothetical predicted protein [Drosophila guanche]|uniref:Uncharacterized protein n=1 Tax=Drosophila guanche TaxID=7266 RepID=A0A3B0JW67_DROGU|nr:Hypothetical predicted protein [Drosophila guanche]